MMELFRASETGGKIVVNTSLVAYAEASVQESRIWITTTAGGLVVAPLEGETLDEAWARLIGAADARREQAMKMDIAELDLTVRAFNGLQYAGIDTVAQLVQASERDLLRAKKIGMKSLREIEARLHQMGLELAKYDGPFRYNDRREWVYDKR